MPCSRAVPRNDWPERTAVTAARFRWKRACSSAVSNTDASKVGPGMTSRPSRGLSSWSEVGPCNSAEASSTASSVEGSGWGRIGTAPLSRSMRGVERESSTSVKSIRSRPSAAASPTIFHTVASTSASEKVRPRSWRNSSTLCAEPVGQWESKVVAISS